MVFIPFQSSTHNAYIVSKIKTLNLTLCKWHSRQNRSGVWPRQVRVQCQKVMTFKPLTHQPPPQYLQFPLPFLQTEVFLLCCLVHVGSCATGWPTSVLATLHRSPIQGRGESDVRQVVGSPWGHCYMLIVGRGLGKTGVIHRLCVVFFLRLVKIFICSRQREGGVKNINFYILLDNCSNSRWCIFFPSTITSIKQNINNAQQKNKVICILPSYLLSLCLDLDRDLDLDGDLERDKDDLDLCLSRLLVYFCLPLALCPLKEAEPVSWRLLWLPLWSSFRKKRNKLIMQFCQN